jgi:hypothetical protein
MNTQPTPPFWFHQRQGALEPAGEDTYRLTAPNLSEAFIGIHPVTDGWAPIFRLTADGPDLAPGDVTGPTPLEAWLAAFELYRVRLVV